MNHLENILTPHDGFIEILPPNLYFFRMLTIKVFLKGDFDLKSSKQIFLDFLTPNMLEKWYNLSFYHFSFFTIYEGGHFENKQKKHDGSGRMSRGFFLVISRTSRIPNQHESFCRQFFQGLRNFSLYCLYYYFFLFGLLCFISKNNTKKLPIIQKSISLLKIARKL